MSHLGQRWSASEPFKNFFLKTSCSIFVFLFLLVLRKDKIIVIVIIKTLKLVERSNKSIKNKTTKVAAALIKGNSKLGDPQV